jgi:hypothetical protein
MFLETYQLIYSLFYDEFGNIKPITITTAASTILGNNLIKASLNV